MPAATEAKGLRFEVYGRVVIDRMDYDNGLDEYKASTHDEWEWQLVGAEGPVCRSATTFGTEKEARSHLQSNKGRMGNAKRCKVLTVDAPTEVDIDE